MRNFATSIFVWFLALLLMPLVSTAGPIYGFSCITINDPDDALIGESQLLVEVIDSGGNVVAFEFANVGTERCSITHIYFYDGALINSDEIG